LAGAIRGFFYDQYVPWYAGTPAATYEVSDFDDFTRPGRYHIRWREGTDATDADGREISVTLNNPNAGSGRSYWFDGILEVDTIYTCTSVSSYKRTQQKLTVGNSVVNLQGQVFIRNQTVQSPGGIWQTWKRYLNDAFLGDGFKTTNGVISVPEMQGATSTANGVSGLVPAPLKTEVGKVLGADGDWIYPKDVSLDGTESNLASSRGFFYDIQLPWYPGLSETVVADFDDLTEPGIYHILFDKNSANAPEGMLYNNSGYNDGVIEIIKIGSASYVSSYRRLAQYVTVHGSKSILFSRTQNYNATVWYDWSQTVSTRQLGDGFVLDNGILSVLPSDIAINGDTEDLASLRGQIGDPAEETLVTDFNDFKTTGTYWVKWNADTALNRPPYGTNGLLFVYNFPYGSADKLTVRQILYRHGTAGKNDFQIWTRSITSNVTDWGEWEYFITSRNISTGLKMTNDLLSVPEYEGATASAAGTSGLVPSAKAGQADYVLYGDGHWKNVWNHAAYSAGPSAKLINLAQSSFPYTAVAHGWVRVVCTSTTANKSFTVSTDVITGNSSISTTSGQSFNNTIPVSKGQQVRLNLDTFTFSAAYFIYTNGDTIA